MATRDRFIEVGERFNSDDVLSQHLYTKDLVARDGTNLAKHGFPVPWAAQMDALADQLASKKQQRTVGRGGKQAKRGNEQRQVRLGKTWLRQAGTILRNASESPVEPNPELGEAIAALIRPVSNDAQEVGSRVAAVLAIFQGAEWSAVLAPLLPADSDLLAAGQAIADRLPDAKGIKKVAQQDAVVDTADLDELDGRLWYYLKAANRAGRSYWLAADDRVRAAEYNLDLLHHVPGAPRHAPSVAPPATPPAG
jgi:hypothetical protein